MAWVHFDLWSSPVSLGGGGGVDGGVSGLVWSGISPAVPNSPSPCVSVSSLLSDLHV